MTTINTIEDLARTLKEQPTWAVTTDNSDIDRARARADALAKITGGEVTPAVFTANLNASQRKLAEAQSVEVFVVPT